MILDQIVQHKSQELELTKQRAPVETVQRIASSMAPPLDLAAALDSRRVQIIAEVKKASPSRGVICHDFNPIEIAKKYAENQAAAISILTETRYFQGNLDYLKNIDRALSRRRPPLLRKDFIFDPYQVFESRANGADAILLIVAILGPHRLQELLELSHQLGLSCLVEVHDVKEAEIAVYSQARIIGINNRDLKTFTVDINTTGRLRPRIPPDRIVVSESGIKTRQDMENLKNWGVNAALIGETLMASGNIPATMRELL
jgi:indole-3-glycerol phosphate synthase